MLSDISGNLTLLTNIFKSKAEIIDSRPVVIYCCINIRNAWHSTRVESYYYTGFASSFGAAKQFTESKRTLGTRFLIFESPGIEIKFEDSTVYVARHGYRPFEDGFFNHLANDRSYVKFDKGFLLPGKPAGEALWTFYPSTDFWNPRDQHLRTLYLVAEDYEIPSYLPNRRLVEWYSSSRGGDQNLHWSNTVREIKTDEFYRVWDLSIDPEV